MTDYQRMPYTQRLTTAKSFSKALLSLIKNKNIVIKWADKNLGLTILDAQHYHTLCKQMLADSKTYLPLPNKDHYLPNHHKFLSKICKYPEEPPPFLRDKIIFTIKNNPWDLDPKDLKNFQTFMWEAVHPNNIEKTSEPPYFYGIPKVHKPKLCLRPIVAAHSTLTTRPGIWLSTTLSTVIKQTPSSILPDSDKLQRLLELTSLNPKHEHTLITMDINSLYTNIPLDHALERVMTFLQTYSNYPQKRMELIRIVLEYVLYTNIFQYNGDLYKQIRGIAMGSNPAPDIANITVFMDEQECFNAFFSPMNDGLHPLPLYVRLLDDVLMIVDNHDLNQHNHTIDSLLQHIAKHPYFTYTSTCSRFECTFLDIHISINPVTQTIETRTGFKILNSYAYITPHSGHLLTTQRGWIRSEISRHIKRNSNITNLTESLSFFRTKLIMRGHPNNKLGPLFSEGLQKFKDRTQILFPTRNTLEQTSSFWHPYVIPEHWKTLRSARIKQLQTLLHTKWTQTELMESKPPAVYLTVPLNPRTAHLNLKTLLKKIKNVLRLHTINSKIPRLILGYRRTAMSTIGQNLVRSKFKIK